ncbi:MAG: NotI family restriction endonuclease [Chroococcales cyanobacterium]
MSKHPLAEVFGFPIDNLSPEAQRYRKHRLCPYNNKVPSCTKDKANDPLGVCSIYAGKDLAITCPVRFREDWLIAEDAAAFFFPENTAWTSLSETRLHDKNGQSAGNIDLVLVAYDSQGLVIDFGALEVQSVYISGNIRRSFEYYMEEPNTRYNMDWSGEKNYPRPDYLSSSRKRLVPQLLYKGGILKTWRKKQAVALHKGFYNILPTLPEVGEQDAEIAWLIYDLERDSVTNRYHLQRVQTVYTLFQPALDKIATPEVGPMENFLESLQEKLDNKLENPPDAPTLNDLL